jgi:rRNA maturation RNase YbeY
LNIKFFYDKVTYRIRRSGEIKIFLNEVITGEGKIPGDLFFIFTDDKSILELNQTFLKHNYFTDVIAFDNSSQNKIKGEIYISVDTVKRNAGLFMVSLREEMMRVIIHGTLHLCGYSDKTREERKKMHFRQEEILKRFKSFQNGL